MQAKAALTVSIVSFALLSFACGSDPEPGGGGGATGGGGGSSAKGGSGGSATGGSGTGGSGSGGVGVGSGGAGGGGGAGTGGGGGSSTDTGSSDDMAVAETGSEAGSGTDTAGGGDASGGMASFFITSRIGAADFGGLEGADKICQDLAAAVGLGSKTWKAYLSNDEPKVDAKSRIGNGPWYNIKGAKIADDIAGLHTTMGAMGNTPGNTINGTTGLTEKGANIQAHDIMTGSNADGTLFVGQTCMNWTGMGTTRVGHYNRMGGGQLPNSWNSAHTNQGCTANGVKPGGGEGRFYCFATTP